MRQPSGPGEARCEHNASWLYLLTQYFGLNMDSLCEVALKIKWKLVTHLASCAIWLIQKSSVGIVVVTVTVRPAHTGQTILFWLWFLNLVLHCHPWTWRSDSRILTLVVREVSALTFHYLCSNAFFTSGCAMHHFKKTMFIEIVLVCVFIFYIAQYQKSQICSGALKMVQLTAPFMIQIMKYESEEESRRDRGATK